jgi:hypothetical protein
LHDASGERAAVGAGTGSLGTLLKKNAPHCSWRGLWRDRGGDALNVWFVVISLNSSNTWLFALGLHSSMIQRVT